MSEYFEYITRNGQRWDQVSYELYGSAFLYEGIIDANPQYLGLATLPGGVVLRIPVIEDGASAIATESLPPWRR